MTEDLKHLHFTAWFVDDENGPAVMIQQEDGGSDESVMLHPDQLRSICKHFGIMAADDEAQKTIATLQRRMLALCERIGELEGYLVRFVNQKDEGWSREMAKFDVLANLAAEWREDLMPPDQEATRRADATMQCAINVSAGAARSKQADLI